MALILVQRWRSRVYGFFIYATTDGSVGWQNNETEKGEKMPDKINHPCINVDQEQEEN